MNHINDKCATNAIRFLISDNRRLYHKTWSLLSKLEEVLVQASFGTHWTLPWILRVEESSIIWLVYSHRGSSVLNIADLPGSWWSMSFKTSKAERWWEMINDKCTRCFQRKWPRRLRLVERWNRKCTRALRTICLLPHILASHCHCRIFCSENHEMVTVFFSDIVGFTDISRKLPPVKVCSMLDRLYLAFDALANKHEVFKVETIGDAWVGVTNCEYKRMSRQLAYFDLPCLIIC